MGDLLSTRVRRLEERLSWWQDEFTCRFRHKNLPREGSALLGTRFVLMYEDVDGQMKEWVEA